MCFHLLRHTALYQVSTPKYALTCTSPFSEELSDGVEIPMKTEDLDDAFGDGSEMSQTPKKPRAADEAALMYDGSVEAI